MSRLDLEQIRKMMERCPSSFQHFVYLLRGLARGAGSSKSGMSRLALTEK